MKGADWAPLAVMAPDNGADAGWDVDAFVEYHILRMRANAVHRPLQGRFPNVKDHRLLQLAEEHNFLVMYWMYGDEQSGTAPENALGHHAQYHFDVVEALLPFSTNFAMGLGFDLAEWVGDNETNRWVRRLKERFPQIMFGCRVRLDEVRRDPLDFSEQRVAYRAGDYASFEHQLLDKSDYRFDEMLAAAHAPVLPLGVPVHRPLLNEERLRVDFGPSPRPKDFRTAAALAPVIAAHREANIGCVVGMRDAGPNWRWPQAAEEALRAAFTGRGAIPSLLPTVERERNKFGIPLTNPQMGIILNNVCLQHPGWGMVRKDSGLHTTQPQTGIKISRDRIVHGPTGRAYDVLEAVAGRALPTWNFVGRPADLTFVPPVGSPPPPPTEDDDMRIKLSRHRWRRVKIAPEGIANPANNRPGRKITEILWNNEEWFEAPLNNDKPWSVHMIEVFDGALRGHEEEYLVSIELHDGNDWHRVVTPREEKEATSSHKAWLPIQFLRAYEIPANSKWRIKVAHNIAGNTPHVEVDLHAEELA